MSTRNFVSNYCKHMTFVSEIELKSIGDALKDENWVAAMHDELNQFSRNDVWFLAPKTDCMNVIGTKWVFRNKLDESGVITRKKLGWLLQDTIKKRVLTMMKPLHLWPDWKLWDYYLLLLAWVVSNCLRWIWRVHFSMDSSMRKFMFHNLLVLKIINILTMCTSWKKICMDSSKPLDSVVWEA